MLKFCVCTCVGVVNFSRHVQRGWAVGAQAPDLAPKKSKVPYKHPITDVLTFLIHNINGEDQQSKVKQKKEF